jgi:transcriptional regulator with XRE-family HTH domain
LNQGLTQKKLASLIGLHPTMITLLETGRRLGSVRTWDRLEAALEVDQKILRSLDGQGS